MPNPEGSQGRQWLAVTTRCSPRCSTTNPRPSPTVITVPLGFSLSTGFIALIRISGECSCAAFRIVLHSRLLGLKTIIPYVKNVVVNLVDMRHTCAYTQPT